MRDNVVVTSDNPAYVTARIFLGIVPTKFGFCNRTGHWNYGLESRAIAWISNTVTLWQSKCAFIKPMNLAIFDWHNGFSPMECQAIPGISIKHRLWQSKCSFYKSLKFDHDLYPSLSPSLSLQLTLYYCILYILIKYPSTLTIFVMRSPIDCTDG